MFSFRVVLVMFLFALISLVGSTNGECGSSPSWEDLHDEEARRSAENGDKFGRITLDCGGSNGGSSSGLEAVIEMFVGLFVLIWIAIGIWFIFFKRSQMSMNAAAVKPYPGEVGAREMQGYGLMDQKTKTVSMNVPTGKIPNGDTNV